MYRYKYICINSTSLSAPATNFVSDGTSSSPERKRIQKRIKC